MKSLYALPIFLLLAACATTYPTTEMDRELALKLADRPTVIAAAQPIINVNNYNGQQSPNQQASQPMPASEPETFANKNGVPVESLSNCVDSPVYSTSGVLERYVHHCF